MTSSQFIMANFHQIIAGLFRAKLHQTKSNKLYKLYLQNASYHLHRQFSHVLVTQYSNNIKLTTIVSPVLFIYSKTNWLYTTSRFCFLRFSSSSIGRYPKLCQCTQLNLSVFIVYRSVDQILFERVQRLILKHIM